MKELEKKINIFFTLTIALGILYLAHITSVYTIIQYQLYINLIYLRIGELIGLLLLISAISLTRLTIKWLKEDILIGQ